MDKICVLKYIFSHSLTCMETKFGNFWRVFVIKYAENKLKCVIFGIYTLELLVD